MRMKMMSLMKMKNTLLLHNDEFNMMRKEKTEKINISVLMMMRMMIRIGKKRLEKMLNEQKMKKMTKQTMKIIYLVLLSLTLSLLTTFKKWPLTLTPNGSLKKNEKTKEKEEEKVAPLPRKRRSLHGVTTTMMMTATLTRTRPR